MEHDRVALAVKAGDHPAIGAMDDIVPERRTGRLELGDERVEILDLERDGAAGASARLVRNEIGERETTAARQVVLDPPLVAPIAVKAGLEAEDLFVEPARACDVAERIHSERHLPEHERTPFSNEPAWHDGDADAATRAVTDAY